MSAVLVDLGGTHLRCGVWHDLESARVLHRRPIRSFVDGLANRQIWDEIVATITDFTAGVHPLLPAAAPVVVSFPGPVAGRSRILDAPTVAGRADSFPDLQSLLAERTGRQVHILNDISAAAWHMSRQLKADRFMVVTVSSGIGSKIFDRHHRLGVLDDVAYAGEIGHAKADETSGAPACDCGGRGHLGAISSGRGIQRIARQIAKSDPAFSSSLCVEKFGATPETLGNELHLVPAARLADAWALRIVRECTKPLARILLQTVIATGVERVVIIGGFALCLGETYRAILQEELVRRCDYRVMSHCLENLIVMGEEDACLHGAAAYASQICRA